MVLEERVPVNVLVKTKVLILLVEGDPFDTWDPVKVPVDTSHHPWTDVTPIKTWTDSWVKVKDCKTP